jgi:fructose-1,6-bisphosphatase/inositol monophosphatase family enzyme
MFKNPLKPLKNMREFLEELVRSSIEIINDLGDEGRENISAQRGKRVCKAEQVVYENFLECLKEKFKKDFYLFGEDFLDYGNSTSLNKFTLDSLDGTLLYVRQKSKSPPAINIAASAILSENLEFTYNEVVAGVTGNINTKEIWSASKDVAKSSVYGDIKTGGNEEHNTLILFDFYFPSNARARLRLRDPKNPTYETFESFNLGSVTEMMAKVACGEADAFVNMGGLQFCEAPVGYILVKSAGGYVLHAKTGEELGTKIFEPGKRVPIIAAKDENLARKLFEQITS